MLIEALHRGRTRTPLRRRRLAENVCAEHRNTALLLAELVEADDSYTGRHSRDVVELALATCDRLGLDGNRRHKVELAALLHDIGKVRVPKEIINKCGALDEAEWEIVRRHTIDGEQMLQSVGGTISEVARFVRSSHERFDGHGYPDGLRGEEIPLESRIIAACDAFSAMTTDRAYRRARPVPAALAEMRAGAGSQFDPMVVETLEAVVGEQLEVAAGGLRQAFAPAPALAYA